MSKEAISIVTSTPNKKLCILVDAWCIFMTTTRQKPFTLLHFQLIFPSQCFWNRMGDAVCIAEREHPIFWNYTPANFVHNNEQLAFVVNYQTFCSCIPYWTWLGCICLDKLCFPVPAPAQVELASTLVCQWPPCQAQHTVVIGLV